MKRLKHSDRLMETIVRLTLKLFCIKTITVHILDLETSRWAKLVHQFVSTNETVNN